MRRMFILVGDATTHDGCVIEGESSSTHHGKAMSYHGARVYCRTCQSEGRIVGVPPYRPMTLMGKQVALENDLCVCKCDPPPRLLPSQNTAWMSFEPYELAEMGCDQNGQKHEQSIGQDVAMFDRRFRFVDENGSPVSGIRVQLTGTNGITRRVTTDSTGRTPVISGDEGQRIAVCLGRDVAV